jgi:hypothetical protein
LQGNGDAPDEGGEPMATVSFDDLKLQVAMKAEETGTLPTTITLGGTQYTLQMPADMKVRALQAAKDPARLDDLLNNVTFVGTDGSELHA